MSVESLITVVVALQSKPLTARQLADEAGMTYCGSRLLLGRLRRMGYVEFKGYATRELGVTGSTPALYGWKT